LSKTKGGGVPVAFYRYHIGDYFGALGVVFTDILDPAIFGSFVFL
jgi:hypothetical protein